MKSCVCLLEVVDFPFCKQWKRLQKGMEIRKKCGFVKIIAEKFGSVENNAYLCNRLRKARAFSSAGLEHLPYKQRVGGSNPSTPTGVFPRSLLFGEAAGIFLFMHFASGRSAAALAMALVKLGQ